MQRLNQRRALLAALLVVLTFCVVLAPVRVRAQDLTPESMVEKLTQEVLVEIKNNKSLQEGNISALNEAVDRIVMPHIDFRKMTAAAVGPAWRKATPEQREQLQRAFKQRLINTYSGALQQVGSYEVIILPQRGRAADSNDVLVRSEVRGAQSPVQLSYRLKKTPATGLGWQVYNVSVLGAWIVDTYRTQFTQEINAHGIDGLIKALSQNKG